MWRVRVGYLGSRRVASRRVMLRLHHVSVSSRTVLLAALHGIVYPDLCLYWWGLYW